MNTYKVKSVDGCYSIRATGWCVGVEGLKFYKQKEIVAWFTTWDYWMIKDDEEEK